MADDGCAASLIYGADLVTGLVLWAVVLMHIWDEEVHVQPPAEAPAAAEVPAPVEAPTPAEDAPVIEASLEVFYAVVCDP